MPRRDSCLVVERKFESMTEEYEKSPDLNDDLFLLMMGEFRKAREKAGLQSVKDAAEYLYEKKHEYLVDKSVRQVPASRRSKGFDNFFDHEALGIAEGSESTIVTLPGLIYILREMGFARTEVEAFFLEQADYLTDDGEPKEYVEAYRNKLKNALEEIFK